MHHAHIKAILEGVIPEVKIAITAAVDPISVRIGEIEGKLAEIETREPVKGEPGKSLTADDVRPLILEEVAKLPPAEPGKSVSVDDVRPLLDEMVAALPKAEDGKSVTLDDVRPLLEDAVAALPKPQDGKSVTAEDVKPLLEEMVAAIPKPQDGKDAAPLELQQVVEAIKTFDVEQLVADAIAGEYGIDVVAPDAVAKEMAAAVALLAQPIVRKEHPVSVQQTQRPRKMTFERDEQNRIVAAIEE
jgi:hypothetical protein